MKRMILDIAKSGPWLVYLISTADRRGSEISVSDYRERVYKARGGRLVVAQKPGLESSSKLVRLG